MHAREVTFMILPCEPKVLLYPRASATTVVNVIVKSHYEEVIVVIARVRGGAKDECNNNDNLRVQWDLTGFYPIVFDVRHIMQ